MLFFPLQVLPECFVRTGAKHHNLIERGWWGGVEDLELTFLSRANCGTILRVSQMLLFPGECT
jgi:hypothetical protein